MIGRAGGIMVLAALTLTACTKPEPTPRDQLPFDPEYLSTEALALDADLVQVDVSMRGARDGEDVADFADCVVAGYADARGFGFARHVRTTVTEEAGLWRADAVYTISPGLPAGKRTIDVEAQRSACAVEGIPQIVRMDG